MPKYEGLIALAALVLLSIWVLIGLPIFYSSPSEHVHGELLGVKYGEWLIFLATVALFVATVALVWATWALAAGAERTAQRQLRAYVHITETRLPQISVGAHPTVHASIKNAGQTPAYNVSICSFVVVASPDNQLPAFEKSARQGTIPPGEQWFTVNSAEHSLDSETLKDIQEGRKNLYFIGRIEYDDAFSHHRFTNFRFLALGMDLKHALRSDLQGNDAS
jgi:hypothetical protein